MKKVLLTLAFLMFFAGSAIWAFEGKDLLTYPDIMQPNNILINVGIGFGVPLHGDMRLPPLVLGADYALPIASLPFSVGLNLGVATSNAKYYHSALGYTHTVDWFILAIGGRLAYHFNWTVPNLDTYAGFNLGFLGYFPTNKWEGSPPLYKEPRDTYATVYWGFDIGARYFFTPKVGAFLELGYTNLAFAKVGVTFKL